SPAPSRPHPPRADSGKGAELWDTEGRRWLDGAGGAIVVSLGHGDERVVEANRSQAARGAYAHGTMFTSDTLEDYAAELAKVVPVDDARVYPVSGGSEAVETALKMARAYHLARGQDRWKVIGREHSYHGNPRGALDVSGRAALRRPYLPWLARALPPLAPPSQPHLGRLRVPLPVRRHPPGRLRPALRRRPGRRHPRGRA